MYQGVNVGPNWNKEEFFSVNTKRKKYLSIDPTPLNTGKKFYFNYISTVKACQRLLGPNAVTAQVRLAKYVIKGSHGFSIFVPGDFHTINLEDFLAVRYTVFIMKILSCYNFLNTPKLVHRFRCTSVFRIRIRIGSGSEDPDSEAKPKWSPNNPDPVRVIHT